MSFCRQLRPPFVGINGATRASRSCAMTCAWRDWLRALLRRSCHARCIDRVCLTVPFFLCSSLLLKQKSRKKESGALARVPVSEQQVSHARDQAAPNCVLGSLDSVHARPMGRTRARKVAQRPAGGQRNMAAHVPLHRVPACTKRWRCAGWHSTHSQ